MDQMVTTYKYRMEPSRKNVVWVGGDKSVTLGFKIKTKSPSVTKHRTWQPKMPHQKCTLM